MPTDDQRPYIAITIVLEPADILSLIQEVGPISPTAQPVLGAAASQAAPDLIDAFTRLVKVADKAIDVSVLAPLIRREIFYRVLTGENGRYVRDMVGHSRQFQKVTAGMEWLRQNCDRHVSMQELARYTGMSLSTMHQSFRQFTHMTPLDFHKQLRLQRARTLLLVENTDVAIASRKVGYKSVSQFSREYRRLFHCSPGHDTKHDYAEAEHSVER